MDPLLFLLQISDSALPIGSYSHSWGLETAVQSGRLTSARAVELYLHGLLPGSIAPQDGRACARAFRYSQQGDGSEFEHLQMELSAMRLATEPRQASLQMGKRLQQLARKTWGLECPDSTAGIHHAAVFGWICAQAGVGERDAVRAYLYSTCVSLVSAAVRLVPLGQSDGQGILTRLHEPIGALIPTVLAPAAPLTSFAWLQERDCQLHQTLYTRLFQS